MKTMDAVWTRQPACSIASTSAWTFSGLRAKL